MSNEFDEKWEEGFSKKIEKTAEQIEQQKEGKTANGKAEQDKQTETQAQQLTQIATAGAALFHTPSGVGYADIIIKSHRETWAIL